MRISVLENSLFHEFLITKSLADLLNIDIKKSLSLSDKSTCLSLSAKMNLLIDLRNLTKEQKPKLSYYLEIRNQFLHNWTIKTFKDCFAALEGTFSALKKIYKPCDNLPAEEQMAFCYNNLCSDIIDITIGHLTMSFINKRSCKADNQNDLAKYKHLQNKLVPTFWETLESETISKYSISKEDQIKLLDEFIHKTA